MIAKATQTRQQHNHLTQPNYPLVITATLESTTLFTVPALYHPPTASNTSHRRSCAHRHFRNPDSGTLACLTLSSSLSQLYGDSKILKSHGSTRLNLHTVSTKSSRVTTTNTPVACGYLLRHRAVKDGRRRTELSYMEVHTVSVS